MEWRRGFQIKSGQRVLICEDVITTGLSVGEVVEAVKREGGEVVGIGALIQRGETELAPTPFAVVKPLARVVHSRRVPALRKTNSAHQARQQSVGSPQCSARHAERRFRQVLISARSAELKSTRSGRPVVIVQQRQERLWNPGIAAVLSFFFPGVGQIYRGKILRGLIWMARSPSAIYCCGFRVRFCISSVSSTLTWAIRTSVDFFSDF
jgi:TM2 domain-containing membrane protein YozV